MIRIMIMIRIVRRKTRITTRRRGEEEVEEV